MTLSCYPDARQLGPIEDITEAALGNIIDADPDCNILVLGGPPCQDVSLLNVGRKGAFGNRSSFRTHFTRVFDLCMLKAKTTVVGLMECTRMDAADRVECDAVFGRPPFEICSQWWQPITRPRWWWFSTEVTFHDARIGPSATDKKVLVVEPQVERNHWSNNLQPGWQPVAGEKALFSCLTRHTPKSKPMFAPRGIDKCNAEDLRRWKADQFSQAPYQYQDKNLVVNRRGTKRRLTAEEEEKMQGMQVGTTAAVIPTARSSTEAERRRKSLLGNAWHVQVATFCLQALLAPWLVPVVRTDVP